MNKLTVIIRHEKKTENVIKIHNIKYLGFLCDIDIFYFLSSSYTIYFYFIII